VKNVALDLDLEYDNKDLKQPVKKLDPTVTVDAVTRIIRAYSYFSWTTKIKNNA